MSETGGTFPEPGGTTTPLQPIPDRIEPVNFPYRGQEQHGVEVEGKPWIPKDADEQSWESTVDYAEPERPLEPVPVRIVSETARETKHWRAWRHTAEQNATMCAGRNLNRTRIRIRNMSTDTDVFISGDSNCSVYAAFPLPFGTEIVLETETEVYCVTARDVDPVELAILSEDALT